MTSRSLTMSPSNARAAGGSDWLAIIVPPLVILRWRVALRQFLLRAISRQYRVTTLGFLWTVLVPFFTLAIYTFAFGVVMKTRWADAEATSSEPFALTLFAGILVYWLMAQSLGEACGAVVQHTNLVKKTVFPLEIIPVTTVLAGLFQTGINTLILLVAVAIFGSGVHATALLFPIVLAPFVLMMMGLAWFLAALGVFFRDLSQVIGLVLTGALFLSPILYPLGQLSPVLQQVVMFNPVSFIAVQARQVLLYGGMPDWAGLGIYALIAWIVAAAGLAFFTAVRKSFADVL